MILVMSPRKIEIFGLEDFPEIEEGDDIGALILSLAERQGVGVEDGDIVVVAQKIVSKAEGRVVKLRDVEPSREAERIGEATGRDERLVELVLREAVRVVKAGRDALIVETRNGRICLNAGIDKSNIHGEDSYVLLPLDPDSSARRIRERIFELSGKRVGVIVSDTTSRPFRRGQVDMAIGVAGLHPFRDYRGERDRAGYTLKVKYISIADEVASAAELVMGQGREGVPVALVRGIEFIEDEQPSSKSLNVSKEIDLFKDTL